MESSFASPIASPADRLKRNAWAGRAVRVGAWSAYSLVQLLIARLGITEFRRRLFHVAPAVLPWLLPWFEHRDVWGPILIGLAATLVLTGLIASIVLRQFILRPGEENWTLGVLGYVIPIVTSLLIFPGSAELGLMTLQIVALGDGSATFAGKLIQGRSLPWNPNKTVAGFISFCLFGTVAATYSYWGEAKPVVPCLTALFICATATVAAAVVESLPIRSNDNFRVGATALCVGALLTAALV